LMLPQESAAACGMSRQARNAPGGLVYHVLKRPNGRLRGMDRKESGPVEPAAYAESARATEGKTWKRNRVLFNYASHPKVRRFYCRVIIHSFWS